MIVANDVLLAASNWQALYAHNINSGKLLWKKKDSGFRFRSSSATWENDTLYVASKDGIGLLDVLTGNMYSYFKTDYSLLTSTKPFLLNNLIIMGTKNNGLVAWNKLSGKEEWKTITGDALVYTSPYSNYESHTVETPPILVNGTIVFGASDGYLYMVDPLDGKMIQKINVGAPILAAVTPVNDGFLVTDFAGNVYKFRNGKNKVPQK